MKRVFLELKKKKKKVWVHVITYNRVWIDVTVKTKHMVGEEAVWEVAVASIVTPPPPPPPYMHIDPRNTRAERKV